MRVLVTGAKGLVGRATVSHCEALGDEVHAFDHNQLDIADEKSVREIFESLRPEAVINCAAWTDVDGCELDPERSLRDNALGPEQLARASRDVGARLVTLSTDYVFDGTKQGFYTQRDDPRPQSVYAASKLEGERRAARASARTVVVRTGWVFGTGGRNFLSTVVERAKRGERVAAIEDQWGTPTYTQDLAARLRELAGLDVPGTFHATGSGEGASYLEFAREALRAAGLDPALIEAVPASTLRRPAPRPRNTRLRCILSASLGLEPLPSWESRLKAFVKECVGAPEPRRDVRRVVPGA